MHVNPHNVPCIHPDKEHAHLLHASTSDVVEGRTVRYRQYLTCFENGIKLVVVFGHTRRAYAVSLTTYRSA